jgi:hypothetical protein
VVQGQQEPPNKQLQSLKKHNKKKKMLVKRTDFDRLREKSREVRGADGSGGILGRQDTCQEQETNMKSTFLGPSQNFVEKRRKSVKSRRLARKKKGEEVRVQMKGGSGEGYLGHL